MLNSGKEFKRRYTMQYRKLGHTDIKVSLIGLGTMTWGEQNTEQEAHEQLDYALSRGVNLIDTAEMYPVPPSAETQGRTESYLGSWLAKSGRRQDIVLATKAAGPSSDPTRPSHIREGRNSYSATDLTEAVNDSLRRLQTDYIDLYQLHWPERRSAFFGRRAFPWPEKDHHNGKQQIEDCLQALDQLVRAGKIRHIGLSNETPWGVAQFLHYAKKLGLPPIVAIQNPYNLLNRLYESGLSEYSYYDNIGLLAYSPLAMGMLTGKYDQGARPAGARLTLFERFQRYQKPAAIQAAENYNQLARDHGLSPATLALAWINSQPFVTSNLVGATNLDQLKENIDSVNIELSPELLEEIETIHERHPNPAP